MRNPFRINKAESELDKELLFHLEERMRDLIAGGMAPHEARRRAQVELGGLELIKEECRDVRRLSVIQDLFADLRYGIRGLRQNPYFALAAVLTVALGVVANTTIFSVCDPLLFKSLPYPEAARLVRVYRATPQSPMGDHSVSSYLDYYSRNTVLERMAAFNNEYVTLAEQGEPAERRGGMYVTADFFPLLAVEPQLGRVFTSREDQPGAEPVVVLANRFWRTRFGADGGIVGRAIRLNGENATVIGVMPEGFEYAFLWGTVDLWRPIAFSRRQRQDPAGNGYLGIIGRLKANVSLAEADAGMKTLAAKSPTGNSPKETLRLEPLQSVISGERGRQFGAFAFILTGLVMFIACVNLANLQLTRMTVRAREFALRGALGGATWRLMRQSLSESLLISMIGAAIALPPTAWFTEFISNRLFPEEPNIHYTFDLRLFVFTLACAAIAGIVFGAAPAWLASRPEMNGVLKQNPRGLTLSPGQRRFRHALIVAQIAFAAMVLTSAAGLIRGLQRQLNRDPGWRVDGLLVAATSMNGPNYQTPKLRADFIDRLEQGLAGVSGVESAAMSSLPIPTSGFSFTTDIFVDARSEAAAPVLNQSISPRYFETLGIRLLQGRAFTQKDNGDQPQVVIINEAMAGRLFPTEGPIGKRIRLAQSNSSWLEIVGVVKDVGYPASLGPQPTDLQIYRPLAQASTRFLNIEIRTTNESAAIASDLRRIVAGLDRDMPLEGIRTAGNLIYHDFSGLPLLGNVLGSFALVGVLLAAVGIFGIISYSVAQRTGEVGIRMAVGAERSQVLWLILRSGLRLAVLGAVCGAAGSFAIGRVISKSMSWLPVADVSTLLLVAVGMMLVALISSYIPARGASNIDPIVALRHE